MRKSYKQSKVWSGGAKKKPAIKRKKFSKFSIWKDRVTGLFAKDKTPMQSREQQRGITKRDVKTPQYSKSVDKRDINMRVLKPKKDYFIKQSIKSKIKITDKPKKKFNWGQKDLKSLSEKVTSFSFKDSFKNINYYVMKWKITENFHGFIGKLSLVGMGLFIVYLSFFDTYFLIKTYTVEYSDGSFLDEQNSARLIDHLKENRILGVFPNNQLWFVNNQNLTLTAKDYSPNIEYVEVENRIWPNETTLQITTKPILLTLNINNGEMWRIGKDGEIMTEDTAAIKDKLVNVQRPVILDTKGATFQDYPLVQNTDQLNRLYFIEWLWEEFDGSEITILKTEIPSLQDTDVLLTTDQGTELRFNAESIKKDLQEKRIEGYFNNPELMAEYQSGVVEYIDFRVPKRIFICYINTFCAQ